MKRNLLISFYLLISITALLVCWRENLTYLPFGVLEGIWYFIVDTQANAASRSITADISFLYVAASVWMVVEAKRLRIKHSWPYVLFGLLIAISVTFPLFLVARELKQSSTAGG